MVSRIAGFVLVTGGSPSSGGGEGAGVVAGTGVGVGVATTTGEGDGVGAEGLEPPHAGRKIIALRSTARPFCITPHYTAIGSYGKNTQE